MRVQERVWTFFLIFFQKISHPCRIVGPSNCCLILNRSVDCFHLTPTPVLFQHINKAGIFPNRIKSRLKLLLLKVAPFIDSISAGQKRWNGENQQRAMLWKSIRKIFSRKIISFNTFLLRFSLSFSSGNFHDNKKIYQQKKEHRAKGV